MKKKLICLLLVLIAIISLIGYKFDSSTSSGVAKLELEIEMDQLAYRSTTTNTANSNIPVQVRLINSGNTNIVVNGRMAANSFGAPQSLRDITFYIIGPDGDLASFKASVNIRHPAAKDIIGLSPGQSIEAVHNIAILYHLQEIGSYSIYAIYQNTIASDGNNSTWKGEITSNTMIFEITP